jgi:NADH:ubiquinone oxidoreductase subunit 5 (subunit L)/multisubunit Na+/H+ antiporter MnhA subunit
MACARELDVTDTLGKILLAGAVCVPVAGAVVVSRVSGLGDRRAAIALGLGWIAAACAVGALVAVAMEGPFALRPLRVAQIGTVGLLADRLTVSLLVLVTGVGATVESYSLRYLRGSPRLERILGSTSAVVAAMGVVCAAATFGEMAIAWVAAGACFAVVMGARMDLPGVRQSTHRTVAFLATGDAALVVALTLVTDRVGPVDLGDAAQLRAAASSLGALAAPVAVLIVVAALARCAQLPFGGWLPGTVSAPTPVSALLHAGIVNGGGVLLIRLGALASDSGLAMALVLASAATGAVLAALAAPRKPDVKGALVMSTMSQMGFMLAECAVGAYLAAGVHLLGHAMYKATLFLGSGAQVPRRGHAPVSSERTWSLPERVLVAGLAAAAAVSAFWAISRAHAYRGATVLLVFAAITVVTAAFAWSARAPRSFRVGTASLCAVVAMSACYGVVVAVVGVWLAPAMPLAGGGSVSVWWLLVVAVVGSAASRALRARPVRRWSTAVLTDFGRPRVEPAASR